MKYTEDRNTKTKNRKQQKQRDDNTTKQENEKQK